MNIRLASLSDLDRIMQIYKIAKQYMYDNNNKTQWNKHYPMVDLIENDISNGDFYCITDDVGDIHAVFMFHIGDDDTYKLIEDGEWINDDKYGAIHRIASDGTVKGVFKLCLDFCKTKINNIRIDTHENNATMLKAISDNGFQYCGIIYVFDKTKRNAYQLVIEE